MGGSETEAERKGERERGGEAGRGGKQEGAAEKAIDAPSGPYGGA